jgi:hypothetical protein
MKLLIQKQISMLQSAIYVDVKMNWILARAQLKMNTSMLSVQMFQN